MQRSALLLWGALCFACSAGQLSGGNAKHASTLDVSVVAASPDAGVNDPWDWQDLGPTVGTDMGPCKGDPDNPGGIDCSDPCAGKAPPVAPGALDKKILFYAPANYHYGVNKYADAIQTELTNLGYKITLVTSVNDGVKFDECNLWRSFKQIWLFMPCNNQQTMDQQSFDALHKYYKFGGGVVLLTDDHYYSQANPNTHCKQTDFGGDAIKPSDAARVAQEILGVEVEYTGYSPTPPQNVNTGHPLAQVMGLLQGGITWQMIQVSKVTNPDWQWLPLSYAKTGKAGQWAGFIEVTTPGVDAQGMPFKRLALVLTPTYCYHCPPSAAHNYVQFYAGIADYFDTHVAASESKQKSSSAGAGSGLFERSAVPPASDEALWTQLGSPEKHFLAEALVGLARRGKLHLYHLLPFLTHDSFYVRHHAVLAISLLPRRSTVRWLVELLPAAATRRDPRLAMGIARSLAMHHAREATGPLISALEQAVHRKARREIISALGGLRARAAEAPLVALRPALDPELRQVADRALETIRAR